MFTFLLINNFVLPYSLSWDRTWWCRRVLLVIRKIAPIFITWAKHWQVNTLCRRVLKHLKIFILWFFLFIDAITFTVLLVVWYTDVIKFVSVAKFSFTIELTAISRFFGSYSLLIPTQLSGFELFSFQKDSPLQTLEPSTLQALYELISLVHDGAEVVSQNDKTEATSQNKPSNQRDETKKSAAGDDSPLLDKDPFARIILPVEPLELRSMLLAMVVCIIRS